MRIESDLEAKHLDHLLSGLKKASFTGISLAESLDMIKAVELIIRVIQEHKSRKLGVVSTEPDVGKKVVPLKLDPKGKKK